MVQINSASGMYQQEAKRWEIEAPPRKRSRTPSPPRSCRNSREDRRRGADGEGSHYSYGGGDNRPHGREPGAAGDYPRDDPPRREQPAQVRLEANADRARQAEKERVELAQRLQRLEEELSRCMQDVEDQWREKYSALGERHKEMLKLKGDMSQKLERLETQEAIAEKQHQELSQQCRALNDTVTLHSQAEQRALSSRLADGQTIQCLRRQVNGIRQEMAHWAVAEAAKKAANNKKKIEEIQTKLADALWRVEESEAREVQLGDQLKAAEADSESYRKWGEQSLEELRLEKNANKEATRVSMQATHYLLEEKSTLQRQVTAVRLEAKEARDLEQQCKLEIDHLQYGLDQREQQLAAVEDEIRQVRQASTGKQEEIDALTADFAAMKLQWEELSGARDPKHQRVVGSTETLAQFPPIQDREIEEVQVRQTIAIAYDIRAVQRGEITDLHRRMPDFGNVLSTTIWATTAELMKCFEAFTKQRI